jgi:hypothetical protein
MSLESEFWSYHRRNPQVYERIGEIIAALKNRGVRHHSMRTIIADDIRFDPSLRTSGVEVNIVGGEAKEVKINDHYSAYYARLWVDEHPEDEDFFEFRTVGDGRVRPAVGTAELLQGFVRFHRENPGVYDHLEAIVEEEWQSGQKAYSMRTALAKLRHQRINTTGEVVIIDGGVERHVKINNNHAPYYARVWRRLHPGRADFLSVRTCREEGIDEVITRVVAAIRRRRRRADPLLSHFLPRRNANRKNKTNGRRRRS